MPTAHLDRIGLGGRRPTMLLVNRLAVMLCAVALIACLAPAASADSPARERTLTCSDGTTFVGEQVRQGGGNPPATWRNVERGSFPTAFVFHTSTVTDTDGNVVEEVSYDHSQGVDNNKDLVTCSFIIPIGPFTGYTADFVGYFVP
jgi:hypothetical protein